LMVSRGDQGDHRRHQVGRDTARDSALDGIYMLEHIVNLFFVAQDVVLLEAGRQGLDLAGSQPEVRRKKAQNYRNTKQASSI